MPDKAHEQTDKKIARMEKHIAAIYKQAEKDMREKWDKYMENAAMKCAAAQDAYYESLLHGDEAEIAKAKKELQSIQMKETLADKRFRAMVEEMAYKYAHANEIATAYINGQLPSVYAVNYNFVGEQTRQQLGNNVSLGGFSFTLVDESTVKYLAENDELILPKRKVDVPKDVRWNTKQINSQLMQGIVQGESIPKIAKRLQNVTESTKAAAVRNARTMCTSAECKGRVDSAARAADMGVIQKKRWISTDQPNRTRDWHMSEDFERHSGLIVDPDEPFENSVGKIMYPGDYSADPANVWNCRCTIAYNTIGFRGINGKTVMLNESEENA